ncbi:MAG: YjjG family noncanonical pyrimidine nucleotidase [Oscillospiraceae bacterium]|nr:YjjG family noncanonical pyrimidine nucleotidase [Oscillospiraceae bacterium]
MSAAHARPATAVFLDIDDTLLDFHKAEAIALSRALTELGVEPTERTLRRYSEINKSQWELLEDGLLTREQVLLRRFEILFAELGVNISAAGTRDLYERYLSIGHYFMPHAPELLDALYGRYPLYIVSNGSAVVQAGRIASAGIAGYFERIFISEEVGCEKPTRAFFDRCFAQIPDFDRERAIVVGDSLTSDIRGGINAGIRTCWYDPMRRAPRPDILPDYRIEDLLELPPLLARIFPD